MRKTNTACLRMERIAVDLSFFALTVVCLAASISSALAAAPAFRFTVAMDEAVNIDTTNGTPSIPVDVGGQARAAVYTSGTGTNSLTFTYTATPGDLDLDGITVSSPMARNGGVITDLAGNPISDADLAFTPPVTTGVKISYPSLSMDFVNGKFMYNGTVYNSFDAFKTASNATFINDTNGTYFDSAGVLRKTSAANTPRIDYDPVTHEAKGLLIEESRTNYKAYSDKITNRPSSGYGFNGNTTENFTIDAGPAPDGSNTASYAASGQRFYAERTGEGNGIYTMSVWLKAGSGSPSVSLSIKNYQSDTIKSTATYMLSSAWQRFSVTGTTDGTPTGVRAEVAFPAGTYAWGYQLEIGAFPTSYIPTSGSIVTRSSDIFRIPIGSWSSLSAMTISAHYASFAPPGYSTRVASLSDGVTALNVFQLANASLGIIYAQKAINSVIRNSAGPTYAPKTNYKIAGAMDNVSGPLAVNNTLYSNTNAGVLSAATNLDIGNQASGALLNGWISQLKYYPARVADTQLQLLTQ